MKNIIVIFAFLSLVILSSCSKDEVVNSSGEYTPPAGTITETGTLQNWTFGTGFTLKLVLNLPVSGGLAQKVTLSSAPIESNGNFKIYYVPLSDSYYTDSLNFYSLYCFPSITVTPDSLRRANTTLEIYKDAAYRGYLTDKSYEVGNDSTGTYYAYFRGYNSAGSVTGNNVCYENHGNYTDTIFTGINLNFSKGWVNYYSLVTSKSNRKTVFSNTNNKPPGEAIWRYNMN